MKSPISGLGEARLAARARMIAPLLRLTASSNRAARPLCRALRTTLLGQVPRDERTWIERIEAWRGELACSEAPTGMPEFDAATNGSTGRFAIGEPSTSIGLAATVMSLSPQWCLLLMRLVRELQPRSCLELGTGFGISAAYQAAALRLNGSGRLITLEGSDVWARLAGEGFSALGLEGIESRVGPIAETLPQEARRGAPLEFVFIDAEHQVQATLDHFETILPSLADRAVIVLDDADWKSGRQAHAEIGRHERVSRSVLVGRLGIVVVGDPGREAP